MQIYVNISVIDKKMLCKFMQISGETNEWILLF